MKSTFWQLGWRSLVRDLRAGELRLVVVAVALAVAALTAVGFLADRIQGGLQRDARQLLGGDVVVASDNPPAAEFLQQARQRGLDQALSATFPTMARATDERGGAAKLVALKAVEAGYPLRGTLQLQVGERVEPAKGIPATGTVWVDGALLEALGLQVGDRLHLGQSLLRIDAVIAVEPDRGAGFMNFAPRVMLNSADLGATALVQPASRVTYRLALAGPDAAVTGYSTWADRYLKDKAMRGVRLESLQGGRPEMGQTLERAEKFLSLVSLLAALLSAVAVALAARRFAQHHLDDCAMLRVLGLSQRTMAAAYTLEFTTVGLLAALLGVAMGYGVHLGFVVLLAGLVDSSLPAPGWQPVAYGLGMALTLLLAFGLPPVLQLARVPALRVIRRDVGQLRPASLGVLGLGLAGFAALLLVVSRDATLGAIAVAGFGGAVLLFAGVSWFMVALVRVLVERSPRAPRWLALATRQVAARRAFTVVQVSALAVGLLALVLLVLLRTDLVSSWRKASPADAPNRFVINVLPEQAQDFRATLAEAGVQKYDWYPMLRGRLVAVNGRNVSPDDYAEDRAKRLVDREFNLSYSEHAPPNNTVVAGRWTPQEREGISVEEGLAKTLQLQLGDTLRFDMGGMQREGRITSLRKVDWGSMRANFFVMFPVAALEGVPVTYMGAYRAPDTKGFDNALVRRFPNVTNVDMTLTVNQIQRVLDQVIRAVEFLFGFTLAAGLVVLFAAVTATREERAREFAIMRAVGARNSLLRQVQRAELAGVGALAGLLASVVALAVGWALARYVFEFDWSLQWATPFAGALAGALLAWLAGWWGLRDVLRRPVVETLRRAAV
ncbi:FtsX-like permease family protein [Curvibacter sp. APW13]|uniref:ABC transporter permease n=1 Tax=Curvibacter sp. APW13 TaxID=3077236 RepID=UPI0028DE749D|nr:FtsX-like permease family protein [Curvibacter sp. APW13]MDT8989458.1 FtsX-like permease family protein [Curvibacter sp. APW13]